MSASENISREVLLEQAIAYRNTAFNTEDGDNARYLTSFSWAGGGSTYSFGVYQFDVGNNQLAANTLSSLGFSDAQISELSTHGDIDSSTLASLNSQLQSALSTTAGQQIMNDLESDYEATLVDTVSNILDNSSSEIISQLSSDPESIQRVMDFANQFGTKTLQNLSDFLTGDTVTSSATGISATWDNSISATDNLQGWFSSLAFGESAAGVTRSTAFNTAVANETLPETVIDITQGDGDDADTATFTNLQNVQVNVDAGITVNVTGTTSNDTFNLSSGSSVVSSISSEQSNLYSFSTEDGSQSFVSVSGDSSISAVTSSSGDLNIVANNSVVNLEPGAEVNIIGDGNVITGGTTDSVSVFGDNNSAFLGSDSTGTVVGTGNTITGGASENFSIYGDANNVNQLTETKINNLDGSSEDTLYNTSTGDWSTITNTYSGQNETGTLTSTLTNNLDGSSTDITYDGDVSITNSYSGQDDSGKLTESLVDNSDGTSVDTVYNTLQGSWDSVINQYSGPNDTGSLTQSLVNNADGTSQETVYGSPDGALVSMTENYSGADGTGTLTESVFNFSDGTSSQTVYNQTSDLSWNSVTNEFSQWNASGTLSFNITDNAPDGAGSSSYIPGGDLWGASGTQLSFGDSTITVPDSITLPSFTDALLNGSEASGAFDTFTADSLESEGLTISNWVSDADQFSFDADLPSFVDDSFGGDLDYGIDTSQDTDKTSDVNDVTGDVVFSGFGEDTSNDDGGDDWDFYGDGDGDDGDDGGWDDGDDGDDDDGDDGGFGGDPLVLSLDGHAIQLIPLSLSHAQVEIDGQSTLSGWIGADTGVLAIVTDTGAEIINPGMLSGANSAMAVLASYDLNQDGVIDASDAVFSQLRVMADPSGNGTAQAQLFTLAQLGIQAIRLSTSSLNVNASGNQISGVATVVFTDGTLEPIENVSFAQGTAVAGSGWNGAVNPIWQQIASMVTATFNSSAYSIVNDGSLPAGNVATSATSQTQQVASQDNVAIENRVTASSAGNGISLKNNTTATINGNDSTVTLMNNDNGTVNGGDFAIEFEGNGSVLTTNGNANDIAITGSSDSVTANGSKNVIVIDGTNDTATTSSSTLLTMNSSAAVINGLSNVVGLGSDDQVTTNGNNFTSAIEGSNSSLTANGNNNSLLVIGDTDTVWANGSSNVVVVDGLDDVAHIGGGSVFLANNSQAVVDGSIGVIRAGSNENLQVNGSGFTTTANGNASQIVVNGDGNNTIAKGANDVIVMNGASAVMTMLGDNNNLTVNGNQAKFYLEGNNNTLAANGQEDTVYLDGDGENVSLSGGTAILADGDTLTINGGNNEIAVGNNETLVANGGNEDVYLEADNSSVTTNGDSEQLLISGNNNNVTANGQNNTAEVSGSNDVLSTGNAKVVLSDASELTLNGTGDDVRVGNADALNVNGGSSTLLVEGSASVITANGDKQAAIVEGVDNEITLNGAQAVVTVVGNNNMVTANGPDAWIQMQGQEDNIVANGPGDLVLLQGENSTLTIGSGTVAISDDTQAQISGVDDKVTLGSRNNVTINGGDFVINMTGQSSTATANGDREYTTVKGNQNTLTTNGSHSFTVVSGNNDTVTANGDSNNISIHGEGNVLYANGSDDQISLDGTQNDLHTSGNTITLSSNGQAWLNGGGNNVVLNDQDNVSINGSGYDLTFNGTASTASLQGDWSTVTLNGNSNTFTANGNGDVIQSKGSNNTVTVNGTGGEISVQGSDQMLVMESGSVTVGASTQATLQGHGNIVTAGNAATVEIDGGDNWINAQSTDTVLLTGDSNGAGFSGTGGKLTVDGSGQYALMNGGNASLDEGASLQLSGDNNTVTGAANSTLDLYGTGNVVNMNNANLIIDATSTSSAGNTDFQIKGFGYTSAEDGQFASAASTASLQALQQTGANSVQIVVTQYLDSVTSDSIAPTDATESDADLELAIEQSQADGMSVLLKPHIDITDGTWRALLEPSNVSEFFANYKTFILHYAAIAQATHASMFSVGTELTSLSGSAYTGYWDDIIAAVRQVYTGPITYASAWNETGSVSFWDKVDVIGANAYEAPTSITDPTVAQMVAGWNSVSTDSYTASLFNNLSPIDFYHSLSTTYDKPVLLTEVGYRSVNGTNTLNGDWTGFHWVDFQQQARALEAFFEAWSGQGSWMEGAYLWNWEANPGQVAADDFSVQGKPAQNVVDSWYGGDTTTSAATTDDNILNGDFNSALIGAGNALTVNGDSDTVTLSGNDSVTLNGAGDSVSVSGINNVIQAGTTTSVTLSTDNSAVMVSGAAVSIKSTGNDSAIAYSGDQSAIQLDGDGNTLVLTGNENTVLLDGKNQLVSTSGQGNNITVTGDNADILTGGATSIALTGNQIQSTVQGDADSITISGNGNTLTLNGSADTVISANAGMLVLNATNIMQDDSLVFQGSVSADQLWFSQSGNDLIASVIGTQQEVDVSNWFGGNSNPLSIKSGDGHALINSQLDNLISAMASMSPPAAGQTTLSQDQLTHLKPALDAAWS